MGRSEGRSGQQWKRDRERGKKTEGSGEWREEGRLVGESEMWREEERVGVGCGAPESLTGERALVEGASLGEPPARREGERALAREGRTERSAGKKSVRLTGCGGAAARCGARTAGILVIWPERVTAQEESQHSPTDPSRGLPIERDDGRGGVRVGTGWLGYLRLGCRPDRRQTVLTLGGHRTQVTRCRDENAASRWMLVKRRTDKKRRRSRGGKMGPQKRGRSRWRTVVGLLPGGGETCGETGGGATSSQQKLLGKSKGCF
jgi:hypothetical protein